MKHKINDVLLTYEEHIYCFNQSKLIVAEYVSHE